ncbi:MAG: hypothetical protein GC149_18605 [Gammaproteobacteria bacterium]|nr:hypothetical protein [Gammaproteobacteria bacterium]
MLVDTGMFSNRAMEGLFPSHQTMTKKNIFVTNLCGFSDKGAAFAAHRSVRTDLHRRAYNVYVTRTGKGKQAVNYHTHCNIKALLTLWHNVC